MGSSSYITDREGRITQHTEYIAFGEVLFEEHSTSKTMPYLFNGKELDTETGLYYYGARYYDPKTSIFLNVDPLAEKTMTPYAYTNNNPIMLVDPTGMESEGINTDLYNIDGKKIGTDGVNNGVKMVVTDRKEANQISKIKGNIDLNNVKSAVTLPSNATLKESLNVLDRTIANGGLREEASIVMNNGTVIQSQTGSIPTIIDGIQTANISLPDLPVGTVPSDVEATIHSHPIKVQQVEDIIYPQSANLPSDQDRRVFSQYNTNIIVGPLGTINSNDVTKKSDGTLNIPNRVNGAVIYNGNTVPKIELTRKAIQNILKN